LNKPWNDSIVCDAAESRAGGAGIDADVPVHSPYHRITPGFVHAFPMSIII
jgi:hypothetical protein